MNFSLKRRQNFINSVLQNEEATEYLIEDQDCLIQNKKVKKIIQINFDNKKHQIIYSHDDEILKIEYLQQFQQNFQIFYNIEQIKYLSWLGQYSQNRKKNGEWIVIWKGVQLMGVGGYYKNGLKQGLWKEIIRMYNKDAQVFIAGEYYSSISKILCKIHSGNTQIQFYSANFTLLLLTKTIDKQFLIKLYNDFRVGLWKYIYNGNEIKGGSYRDQGLKNGKWTVLSEKFKLSSQIIYTGEYNMMGKKVGRWDISWLNGKQIGGGVYVRSSNNKVGMWIELDKDFYNSKQIIHKGKYNLSGKKEGAWDICWLNGIQIGGGVYHISSNNKSGKWIELDKSFNQETQITFNGEYNLNGQKVGRWDTNYNYCNDQQRHGQYHFGQHQCEQQWKKEQIGGGSYDDQFGRKIGIWIEVDEDFCKDKLVTYVGEYSMNGIKVGTWCILYNNEDDKNGYKYVGGGVYDHNTGKKFGKWIELEEQFYKYRQIIYNGEYNKDGMKTGKWDIHLYDYQFKIILEQQSIGGGSYNSQTGKKIGFWVELDKRFKQFLQVFQNGEYDNQGMKVGRWDIWYKNNGYNNHIFNKQIGRGCYDNYSGSKIGRWVELDEKFNKLTQITYQGEYDFMGKKINRWDTIYNKFEENGWISKQIGGGQYDNSNGIKVGHWVELVKDARDYNEYTYNGEYDLKGKKINTWAKIDIKRNIKCQEIKYDN